MDELPGNDYARWSGEELQRAESVADRFLAENGKLIFEGFHHKVESLAGLVKMLRNRHLTLDQRLDCFARIAEISQLLKQDAEGFFGLASEPVVARLLANIRTR